ncbi:MAG: hypothetical protein PHV97_00655 [Candidatus Omnitrophica bacterium]|nr:hypothetical protein [Candidatus Omnitrophota bacterium]
MTLLIVFAVFMCFCGAVIAWSLCYAAGNADREIERMMDEYERKAARAAGTGKNVREQKQDVKE